MRINGQRYTVDYGHLALITAIAVAIVWYLFDARSVSTSLNNILLVQPMAIFAIIMYLMIVPQCFSRVEAEEVVPAAPQAPDSSKEERSEAIRTALMSASLGAMVLLMNVIGFDVAIFLFSLAAMAICGERRPLILLGFSLAITLGAIYAFRAMIPFPMFTLIL